MMSVFFFFSCRDNKRRNFKLRFAKRKVAQEKKKKAKSTPHVIQNGMSPLIFSSLHNNFLCIEHVVNFPVEVEILSLNSLKGPSDGPKTEE